MITVYTALFTDRPKELFGDIIHYEHDREDVQYICYTNSEYLKSDFWEIKRVPLINNDPRRTARWYKYSPAYLEFKYSRTLWMDAQCYFLRDPKWLMDHFLGEKYDWAVHRHCDRIDLWQEGELCIARNRDPENKIGKQIQYYNSDFGYIDGLYETGILFRDCNSDWIHQVNRHVLIEMEKWKNTEDQVCFPWVLHKYGDLSRFNAIPETFVEHTTKLGRPQSNYFGTFPREWRNVAP